MSMWMAGALTCHSTGYWFGVYETRQDQSKTNPLEVQDDFLWVGGGPGVAHGCALGHQDATPLNILPSRATLLHGIKHVQGSLKAIQDEGLSGQVLSSIAEVQRRQQGSATMVIMVVKLYYVEKSTTMKTGWESVERKESNINHV